MKNIVYHFAVASQIFILPITPNATKSQVITHKPVEVGIVVPNFQKIEAMPVSDFEPYSSLDSIEVTQVATPTPNTQSSTANLASMVVSGCGDNAYANFIYMHESGCNLNAVNSIGCRGIGQACPGSKLPCGADYACQNAWFSNYANSAYGGWSGAYNFWLSHHWW